MSTSFLVGVAVGTLQTRALWELGAWLKRRSTWGRLGYRIGPTINTHGRYIHMAWRDRYVCFRR